MIKHTLNSLINTIGKEQVEKYVKLYFGHEANLNILNEIGLGESKGWANEKQEEEFIAYVIKNNI